MRLISSYILDLVSLEPWETHGGPGLPLPSITQSAYSHWRIFIAPIIKASARPLTH